jgi:hypothetical protein
MLWKLTGESNVVSGKTNFAARAGILLSGITLECSSRIAPSKGAARWAKTTFTGHQIMSPAL